MCSCFELSDIYVLNTQKVFFLYFQALGKIFSTFTIEKKYPRALQVFFFYNAKELC